MKIWFAEKRQRWNSEIYALSDYILEDDKNAGKKVRNDATYNKRLFNWKIWCYSGIGRI